MCSVVAFYSEKQVSVCWAYQREVYANMTIPSVFVIPNNYNFDKHYWKEKQMTYLKQNCLKYT